jgi:PAS domain S-box-containing protein
MVNATPTPSEGLPNQATDRFRFLAELIPQLVWITDPLGFHTYFNQRWIDFTGYTVENSIGPDMWNNLLHPDDRQRARERWTHSLKTGEFYEIEYRFLSKDGSYRWFLGQALPQRDAQGEIEEWFGTCTYIDDQKQAQLELQRVSQDFTTLANAIPQLAWMADNAGEVFWYNQRWFDYTGCSLEDMRNRGWAEVHHPDYLERVVKGLELSYQTGEPWEDTFPLRSQTGEYRWFLSRALPVRDEQGQIVRWCGTSTDITQQKTLQEQLERSYADLEVKVTFRTLELEREVQELRHQQEK